jgi:hypothetical protein
MDILNILKIIAALATIATGVLAFVRPAAVYGFTGLRADGPRGVSEVRSILGGLLIGLGAAPFAVGAAGYTTLGIGYLTIAAARAFSVVYDRSYASSNLISLGVEVVLGVVLVL